MEQIIHLKSESNHVSIKLIEDDHSGIEKTIMLKDFSEIFKQEERKVYIMPHELFWNYENTEVVQGMLYGEKEGSICKGIFFVPASTRYMDVSGEKAIMPYPSIVFSLVTVRGRLTHSKCYAVQEKSLNELKTGSRLYAFPFGNVLYSDGHICWGQNKMTDMYDYEALRSAITIFFSAESNKDYVHPGKSYSGKYGRYESFLGKLKKRKTFPMDALVYSPCENNLGELIETIQKGEF